MICPECGESIHMVNVMSYCTQIAVVRADGQLTDYGKPEAGETISIHCSKCDGIITSVVKEE